MRWNVLGRATVLLPTVAIVTTFGAAIGAACISKLYWGYWIRPPAMDQRVLEAAEVVSVTPVTVAPGLHTFLEFVPSADWYRDARWYAARTATGGPQSDYYLLEPRALRALEERGTIRDPLPALADDQLRGLVDVVRQQGDLVRDTPGYNHLSHNLNAPGPRGYVYELVGKNREPLVLVAWRGGPVANDHYPYYEHLFAGRIGEPLTLVSRRQFYFDIAGMEGMTFAWLFRSLSLIGLAVTIPTTALVLLLRRQSGRSAIVRGLCPRCRYDLRGQFTAGCSECGWGQGQAAEEFDASQYTIRAAIGRALTKPPGWIVCLLAFGSGAAYLIGVSTPRLNDRLIWWGSVIGAGVIAVTLAKAVGYLRSGRGQVRLARSLPRFGLIVAMTIGTVLARRSELPLRLRFALSRPAFDREVADKLQNGFPGTGPERLVGLYWSHGTIRLGPGVAIMLAGGGGGDRFNGFVTFPDGKPDDPVAFDKHLDCAPIGDGWYLWRYGRSAHP